MAGSDSDSSGASQLPTKLEAASTSITIKSYYTKLPRRQLTLIAITALLNVLLWSSLICVITSVYQVVSDPDTTSIPSHVLTLTSAVVTIAYIFIHTIFSLKQRIWKHQRRNPSAIRKTSYVAIRLAVTLCILWLLTSGWNMIIVARRPVCLAPEPGREGWEAGTPCVVGRVGIAFAMIALIASGTLFGMLAMVRRPFEAHLLKHGYREPVNLYPTPAVSGRPTPSRLTSNSSDRFHSGRRSTSTHRSTMSNFSNADVETLDLNSSSPPTAVIHSPSPVRSIGLGIFTSDVQPPPVPPAFTTPSRASSLETPPPIFHPTVSYQHLPPPPRMSALVAPSGFVPLSIPVMYSASAMRAVHPNIPSPLGPIATRSNLSLPHTNGGGSGFTYRNRYSRSSVSLTRPHRLSSTPATSVAWSSRSGSTGPEDDRSSPSSGREGTNPALATANEIAFAILNGTPIPGTEMSHVEEPQGPKMGHIRRASAPADTTAGAQEELSFRYGRKAKGWKPRLAGQRDKAGTDTPPLISQLVRSNSADLLSRFSPDSSPDDNNVNMRNEFEKELDLRLSIMKNLPFRKSRSASPLTGPSDAIGSSSRPISRLAQQTTAAKHASQDYELAKKRMTYDEVKNKPLPKIATL